MTKQRINYLKDMLNGLLEEGASINEVYPLSIKLDELIVEYYHETLTGQ